MTYETKTLFLDRDGVINERIPGDYVRNWDEFTFLDGVLEALNILARKFNRIVVVTNQQGIAKGLMTEEDLNKVHEQMVLEIQQSGGKIDKVYFCPLSEKLNPHCRKPNPGMAEQAQKDFPEIDFEQSIMVGDSISDIEFGKRLKMKTVFIQTKNDIKKDDLAVVQHQIDYTFFSLLEFAQNINNILI